MKLNRLTDVIFQGVCRQYQLRDSDHREKKPVIKQALVNTLILKNANVVHFLPEAFITIKFQRVNKVLVQEDMVYVCVEYGYQNIRIYNISLKETITLGELMTLLG